MMLAYTAYMAFAGGILGLPLLRFLLWPFMFLLLSRHKVPITGRRQILHRDAEQILMERSRKTQWYMDFISRPRLGVEDPLTEAVQAVLNQLSMAKAAKEHNFKLVVCDDLYNKFTATAFPGGTIFISTSQLSKCCEIGQVGAILAHEMGHLIARHTAERFSSDLMSNNLAELFGVDRTIYNNLAMSIFQELEADNIGLMLMSETGFDPQNAADYLKGQMTGSWNSPNGKSPLSGSVGGELNSHPSVSQLFNAVPQITSNADKVEDEGKNCSNRPSHAES